MANCAESATDAEEKEREAVCVSLHCEFETKEKEDGVSTGVRPALTALKNTEDQQQELWWWGQWWWTRCCC